VPFHIGPIHAFIPLSTFRTFAAGSDQSPLGINPLTLKQLACYHVGRLLLAVEYRPWCKWETNNLMMEISSRISGVFRCDLIFISCGKMILSATQLTDESRNV